MKRKLMWLKILQKHKIKIAFIVISVCVILPYLNSINTSFQLDDFHTIVKNKQIGNFDQFSKLDTWGRLLYNRQIPNLTFSINYIIDGYNEKGYHLLNILIHLINSILIFFLILKLFSTRILSVNHLQKYKFQIALFTAIIFAVHPVQIQAVTYVTQRMVSLAVLFYLLSIFFYLYARFSNNKNKIFYLVLCFISFIFGVYSKEIIFSLPIALIAVEFYFFHDQNNKINKKYFYTLIAITITVAILYFLRYGLPKQAEAPDHLTYLLTQIYVQLIYFKLLFLPIGQHLYYLIPIQDSFLSVNVMAGLFVLLVMFFLIIKTFRSHRLISFGILWFYITLSVESTIYPLKFLFFEYRLYPAVLGFSLIIVYIFFLLIDKLKQSTIQIYLSLIALVFGYLTFQHNKVWKDPISLWTNNVIESPYNKEAHKNLGIELMLKGRMREAFYSFTKSIELDSSYAEPYAHRAVILSEHTSFQSAIGDANKALTIDSNRALYYNNRGYVYQFVKDYKNAIKDFKKAISIDPKYDNVIKNLSVTHYHMGNYDEAMLLANRSIELDSTKEEYFNNRGNIYFALNNFSNAEKDFLKALTLKPNFSKALNNIGVVKLKLQKIDEAIYYFTKTLEIDNRFIDSYYYRGYCSLLKGDKQNAYNDLTQCINLQKNHPGALALLNQYFNAK